MKQSRIKSDDGWKLKRATASGNGDAYGRNTTTASDRMNPTFVGSDSAKPLEEDIVYLSSDHAMLRAIRTMMRRDVRAGSARGPV